MEWGFIPGKAGSIAYNSVEVMQELGYTYDTHRDACMFNDFALIEITIEDLPLVHPSMLGFGGPTGLADSSTLGTGDEMRGYGSSSLRYGITNIHDNPVTHEANHKYAVIMMEDGEFGYDLYSIGQGIPGDSGGPMLTIDGEAWGIASVISYAGGYNVYARLDVALAFMEEHVGWRPELVTSDDFDSSPT